MSMSFNTTCYRIAPFMLSLLLSGCASQIQKTLDRSILIQEQCDVIEQALPMKQDKLEHALIDAIALRLLGSCLDDDQRCLNPAPGEKMPSTLISSVQEVMASVQKQQTALRNVGQEAGKEAQKAVGMLKADYDQLSADISTTRDVTAQSLRDLRDTLRKTRERLTPLVYKNKACVQRTDCIAAFAQQMTSSEEEIRAHVAQLKTQAARLAELGQRATAIANSHSALLPRMVPKAVDAESNALLANNMELQKNARQLADNAVQLSTRLDNGTRTLGSLFSPNVETAATELMAARLYDKGADRLLGVIDRMLSQLDRTIDKVDDHAYGGVSIMMQVFSGDIQEQFDRIFTKLIDERYQNNSAKLAFASAACRRLGMGDGPPVQNASMFSPFLYATLTRVAYEISDKKNTMTLKESREAWEKQLGKTTDQLAKNDTNDLTGNLTIALRNDASSTYQTDSESTDGQTPSAPSMLQQVALCAAVEQQLVLREGLTGKALKERTLAACGSAAMDAVLAARQLRNAGSQQHAQLAIDTAPAAAPAAILSIAPSAGDAKAWREAMEAVLKATAPKTPGSFKVLCRQIVSQIKGSRCSDGIGNSATLDFDATFSLGQHTDKALEWQLVQLADILYRHAQDVRLEIDAYASRKSPPCPARLVPAMRARCSAEKNAALAKSRADWAFNILQERMGERFVSRNQKNGSVNPLSYDTATDRRVRITLWSNSGQTQAPGQPQ